MIGPGEQAALEAASVRWVVSLETLAGKDRDCAGSKAVNLGTMIRAGLPVPPGFCVTTKAYQLWLDGAEGAKPALDLLERSVTAPPQETQEAAAEVRQRLAAVPVPDSVERAIGAALGELGPAGPCAVRSSATLEDLPDASFAGQHDTFLNVCGREPVLDAVRRCWVSLFTNRAVSYRLKQGIPHRSARMAVIVQAMVPASKAGVLFTLDPVTGNAGRMVIEGTRGLGDALVSGKVNPDRVVLDKGTLRPTRRGVSRKLVESMPDAAGGVRQPDIAGLKRDELCLDEALARRLGKLARKVERLFGGPQDIEWATAGDQIFLLQARPVTATRPAKSWDDRQVWTNLNTGEVFPDVVTPMTWTMIQLLLDPLFRSIFRLFGADVARSTTAGLVAGRIYFNVNTGLAALKPFSFAVGRVSRIGQALGGGQIEEYQQLLTDLADEDLPDLGFGWLSYILSWPRVFADLIAHSPGRSGTFLARMKARGEQVARLDFAAMSTPELARAFSKVLQESLGDWDLLHLFTRAGVLLVFEKAARDWLGDPELSLGYRLFAGLGGIPETEAGLALWQLAALAHADPQTETVLLSEASWPDLRAPLERTGRGRQFLAAWDAFMAEHGHHCRGELELSNARWSERPDYILGLVRGYLRSIGQSDPVANQQRLARERQQLTEECRRRLKNPLKRAVFSWSLRRAQQLAVDREDWKDRVVRHITVLRRMLLMLGERLEQQGVLARRDDVFFLEVSEIEPVGTGQTPFDVQQLLAARRAEYEKNLRFAPPPVVKGRYDPATHPALPTDANATVLMGIGVFPGTVTGRAKVILRTDDHQQVLPGEILVAPFSDPAWTPYFVLAAGVVMDQGGILSHGSIVAREYGLPAVTNVRSATRIIRTGDLVQVDGERGQVTVLARC